MKRLPIGRLLLLVSALTLVQGCQPKEREPEKLKIVLNMPAEGPAGYRSYYGGELFESKHPEVDIEYVNFMDRIALDENIIPNYLELIRSEKPDVVVSPYYATLAERDMLLDLTPYIRKSKFDLDAFYPAVLDWLRAPAANRQLYGLAPQFDGTALFYNKSMFDRYGIQPPAGGLTWPELLLLAQRFPAKDEQGSRQYGFHLGPFSTAKYYADAMLPRLRMNDPNGLMTMDTASWRQELEPVLKALASGSLSYRSGMGEGDESEFDAERIFSEGRAAMILGGPNLIDTLANAPFEWGFAARPVDPVEKFGDAYPNPVYSIYRDAVHKDLAWEYIAYMNGEEASKLRSRSAPVLLSRTDIGQERGGRSLEPFYELDARPPAGQDAAALRIPPFFFSENVTPLIDRELDRVVQGSASLDEALRAIQTEGQALLNRAIQTEEGDSG